MNDAIAALAARPKRARVTLEQLRVFVTVAETGGFGRAAAALHLARSAVSYGVANLEAALGVQLFDRSNTRRLVITPSGRRLLGRAARIVAEVDALEAQARLFDG